MCTKHVECECLDCGTCAELASWWLNYNRITDDLIARSNVHICRASRDRKWGKKYSKKDSAVLDDSDPAPYLPEDFEDPIGKATRYGQKECLNQDGMCMARFLLNVRDATVVSQNGGHIFMKKLEPMINTFIPALTYLSRYNTDVSSLLSGTSIKAIISYITDYVTKPSLKTHQVYSSAYNIFSRNMETLCDNKGEGSKARSLIIKIVNALASKMEIGSLMACLYLLDNPDHYTGHTFVPFWWRSYVSHIQRYFHVGTGADGHTSELLTSVDDEATLDNKVVVGMEEGRYVGKSVVDNYAYRPDCYAHLSLLQWVQISNKRKRSKKHAEAFSLLVEADTGVGSGLLSPYNLKYNMFHKQHPLYLTHEVTCDEGKFDHVVPNFLGGSLPRRDQGDREYYCSTMLTLLKPWRCGLDLKSAEQNWNDAFVSHEFTQEDREFMNNLNL